MVMAPALLRTAVISFAALLLIACSGGGSGRSGDRDRDEPPPPPAPVKYSIGGNVSGLAGTGLALRNNGGDNLTIAANGTFQFSTTLASGSAFNVSVFAQPANPAQECTVTRGNGVVGTANVTNVEVACINTDDDNGGDEPDDGGDDPAPTPTPLSFTNSTPATGAVNVDRAVRPELLFSVALDAASVNTSSVKLFDAAGSEHPIATAVTGNQLTIEPKGNLEPMAQYRLLVEGIRGIDGQTLSGSVQITFTVRERAWQLQETLRVDLPVVSVSTQLQTAIDSDGNVTSVWREVVGVLGSQVSQIWARRYDVDAGIGEIERLDTIDNMSTDPQVGVDGAGDVMVIWTDHEEGIQSRRYDASTGAWRDIVPVDPIDAPDAEIVRQEPRLAVAANGDTVALWLRTTADRSNVYAATYTADDGWSAPTPLQLESTQQARNASVAIRADGSGMVVWEEIGKESPFNGPIWAAPFDHGQWQPPVHVNVDLPVGGREPVMAVDNHGNALVAWTQVVKIDEDLFEIEGFLARRYSGEIGWVAPAEIGVIPNDPAIDAHLAISDHGEAMAVWVHSQVFNGATTWARFYHVADDAWEAEPAPLDVGSGQVTRRPRVAMDPNGNAVVVWEEQRFADDRSVVRGSRYQPDTGWVSSSMFLGVTSPFDPDLGLQISGNAAGDVAAVWNTHGYPRLRRFQ
ncbi:MAG: Ig-like domain-containing protein [Steroidobacter sp.]